MLIATSVVATEDAFADRYMITSTVTITLQHADDVLDLQNIESESAARKNHQIWFTCLKE